MKLSISYPGGKEPTEQLQEMATRLSDFTPIWPLVRRAVNEYQKEIFTTSGFGRYPALKPSTLKKRRRSSKPFDTLSRRMVNSMFGITGDTVYLTTPTSCVIGTNIPIVKYHMTGTKHMAARPVLMITEKLKVAVLKVLRDYVTKK